MKDSINFVTSLIDWVQPKNQPWINTSNNTTQTLVTMVKLEINTKRA